MAEEFTCHDTADSWKSDEEMVAYLDACIADDPADGSLIRVASLHDSRGGSHRGSIRLHRDESAVAQPEDPVEAVEDAFVVGDHDDGGVAVQRDAA